MPILADPRLRASVYLNSMVGDAVHIGGAHATDTLPVSIAEHWNLENRSAARRQSILQLNMQPVDGGEHAPPGGTPPGPGTLPEHLAQTARGIQAMSGEERVAAARQALADVETFTREGLLPAEQAWSRTFEHLAASPGPTAGGSGGGRPPSGPPTEPGDPGRKPGMPNEKGEKRMAGMRLRDILGWSAAGAGGIAGAAGLYDILTPDSEAY